MNIDESEPPGATPLSPEDLEGLIPNLVLRSELNFFEAANIATAVTWAKNSRALRKELLSPASLTLLHTRMFDKTWR